MGLKTVKLPDLGEGVTEGEIIKIKVSEGDSISMDQILVEVMTDKASMEVPSAIEGKIKKVEVQEGDMVSVGAKLLTVETAGSLSQESQPQEKKAKTAGELSKESRPQEKKTEKSSETASPEGLEAMPDVLRTKNQTATDFALAVPATRKLAEELGLSLKNVPGTGPKGEIKREDLIKHIKSGLQSPQSLSISSPNSAPLPQNIKEERREPIRGIKRLMFESMTLSKTTIPHFTIGEQACVERLAKVREEMKSRLKKQGLKTGWLAFFIKALIPVLKEFPIFNSVYSTKTKEVIFRKDLNIGFAVDSPQGLLVPVLKDVQNKSLLEIIREIQLLAEAIREGSIERENLTGASITLTNLGSLGGVYGTPIINPPEMAIVGIYRLFKQVVQTKNGDFVEKPFINLSMTCDHRFIDGATAARFMKSFVQKVEEPSLLLLD